MTKDERMTTPDLPPAAASGTSAPEFPLDPSARWRRRLWLISLLLLVPAVAAPALVLSEFGPAREDLQRQVDAATAAEQDADGYRALLRDMRFAQDPEAEFVAAVASSALSSSMALVDLDLGDPSRQDRAVTSSPVRIVLRGSASSSARMLDGLLELAPYLTISRVEMAPDPSGLPRLTVEGSFRRLDLAASR